MEAKYYEYYNPNNGRRFFRVKENERVLQIIWETVPKKGKAYIQGISYLNYLTFIGSWGWKLSESKNINVN